LLTNRQLTIAHGTLSGHGTVEGATVILDDGILAPGQTQSLNIKGPLTLSGKTVMLVTKTGAQCSSDSVQSITRLRYGGTLIVQASGNPIVKGDTFRLFQAVSYTENFSTVDLPTLSDGLTWDTSQLNTSGTLMVVAKVKE